MNTLFPRMIRAAKLEPGLFEELVDDATTQGQATWVVAILAMGTGFGMFSRAGAMAVNICLVTTFLSWYLWAFTVYFAATYLFRDAVTQTDRKTVMRIMAFANAPGALRLLGVVPQSAMIIFVVTTVWILTAGVIGIKVAFNLQHTAKAMFLCVGTWILAFFFQSLLLVLFFSVFGVA